MSKGKIYVVYEVGPGYFDRYGMTVNLKLITFSKRRATELVREGYNYCEMKLGELTKEEIASYQE